MRTITALSACVILSFCVPAFAQNEPNSQQKQLQQNASPNDPAEKQSAKPGAQAGPAPTEGRTGATDEAGSSAPKK